MCRDMSFGLVVLALVGMASAQSPVDDTSKVMISQPLSLAAEYPFGVEHRPAMFGVPNYQASISGIVMYAVSNDLDGCAPINTDLSPDWPQDSPVIVMMDRGNCTFSQKVAHAQLVGAQAAIIVDNIDEVSLPFMAASETTGDSIDIPSVLIHLDDGARIKEVLENEIVRITLSWDMPRDDNRVEWDFWTSSDDESAIYFKQTFRKVAEALGEHALLTPHYMIWSGRDSGCTPSDGSLPCGAQCTNGGRYCSLDPEEDLEVGLDGAHVVRENLRQMCLWGHLNETGSHLKWWDYINEFEERCHVDLSEELWTPDCSRDIMDELEVDTDAVFQCVEDSGGSQDSGGPNKLFDAEIALAHELQIFILPSLLINGMPYYGGLSCPDPVTEEGCGVFAALCSGFAPDSEPDACLQAAECVLGQKKDECGECYDVEKDEHTLICADCAGVAYGLSKLDDCGWCDGPGRDLCGLCFRLGDDRRVDDDKANCSIASSSMSIEVIIGIVIGSVFVVGCGVYFYMKKQQNAMKDDIDQLLRQYLPMENGPPERTLIPREGGPASDSL